MKKTTMILWMLTIIMLFTACMQANLTQPDSTSAPENTTTVATAPETEPTETEAPTTRPVIEDEPSEEHTSLSFYMNGSEVTKDAVLHTGDGYSIAIFAEGWELQSEMIGGYPADVWKNTADGSVKLCTVKLDVTSLDDARAWVKAQFPEYELLEDSRGGLGGPDADGNMVDVWFYASEDDVYAVFQRYSLDDAETYGAYLGVMVDTFALQDGTH